MKQVPISDTIRPKLQAAAGDGVDISNLAVYEAIALNTKPIRKKHPLYHGAQHTPQFLAEMANALNAESLPLQVMHEGQLLPVGRVFLGEVVNGSELRVLFWVDKVHADLVQKIDNGTIDQVSVSVLPKSATCSTCGFNFLGDEATIDHIWSGTDPKKHTMGKDGHHAVMTNLDTWFEMSLVGKGGATGARITDRQSSHFNDQRLAASGAASVLTTLNLASRDLETESMDPKDLKDFIAQLTDATSKLAVATADGTRKDAEIEALKKTVVDLEAKVTEGATAAADAVALKASITALTASLTDVAKKMLTLAGDATTKVPEVEAELIAFVAKKRDELKLSVTSATEPADKKRGAHLVNLSGTSAFKRSA